MQNDLGVTITANMKGSEQCRIAASQGNQIIEMIRRNITYKEKGLIVPLCKAIITYFNMLTPPRILYMA